MTTITIDPTTELHHICLVAASRFRNNAKLCHKMAQEDPKENVLLLRGEAARQMAEQFEAQAERAEVLARCFASAKPFRLSYEEE